MRFDKRSSKKSKSGYTWRVTLEYKDQFGKTRRYTKSGFTTKKEAQQHGYEIQKSLDAGVDVSTYKTTMDEVFEQWCQITTLRKSSVITYASAYRNYVSPAIGSVPISQIRYPQLQKLFTSLSDRGMGSVSSVRKVLSALGKLAIKSGYIDSWQIDLVEVSGKDNKRQREEYISRSDFNQLLEAVTDTRIAFHGGYRAMTMLLGYYAGLRISECCGLLWSDVDLQNRMITVQHQLSSGSGMDSRKPEIESILKTDSSYGVIPIPDPLLKALIEWREYNPYDLVICTIEGNTVRPASIRTQIKKKASKLGIDYHPHMLRHTFVTNLLDNGVDIKTTSKLARHKDISVTLQIYAEVVGDKKVEAMQKAFGDAEDAPEILA